MTPASSPVDSRRGRLLWAQLLLGVIPLVLLPPIWGLRPLLQLDHGVLGILALVALAYGLAIAALQARGKDRRTAPLLQVLIIGSAAFMPVLLIIVVFYPEFSQFATLAAPLLALALLWFAFSIERWPAFRLAIIALLALGAIALQISFATGLIDRSKPHASVARSTINTSLYELALTSYQFVVPEPFTQQGGITQFGSGYLLATGDGDLYTFDRPSGKGKLKLRRLPRNVPLNAAEFTQAMRGIPVPLSWFRVADVLAQQTPHGIRLLASHHYWKKDERCFLMRVSVLEGTQDELMSKSSQTKWRTLFDTTPCLAVTAPGKAPRFGGLENGGRLALLNDHELLLSVGDHAIDGFGTQTKAAQDPAMFYGKTIRIDLDTGAGKIFTSGHRNPQGLYVAPSGAIWSTEHGPQGGDELNLLKEGANYGWPLATYGVDYGTHAWPLTPVPGTHEGEGFVQPYFSWIPSIGVSSLIEVSSPRLAYWHGDLLVGSLIARTFWRLRVRDGRVVMAEQIPLGERIRKVIDGHKGELVVWTDRRSIMFIEPVAKVQQTGADALYRVCAACHTVPQGQTHSLGPDLKGVVGRAVASVKDFEYSPAMRAAGGVWSRQRLDTFLTNPAAAIPGTTMTFAGIADANTRRDLIEFLASPKSDLKRAPGGGEL